MDYIELDDTEFDNFIRQRRKKSRKKRGRLRRALLSGGLSELGRSKRARRAAAAVATGGASEIGRRAKEGLDYKTIQKFRPRKRILRGLLTGGLSEMKAIRKLRSNCKKKLASARFSSRRQKRRAIKECVKDAVAMYRGAAHTGVARPMPTPTSATKIGRAVSAMPRGALKMPGMFGTRGR